MEQQHPCQMKQHQQQDDECEDATVNNSDAEVHLDQRENFEGDDVVMNNGDDEDDDEDDDEGGGSEIHMLSDETVRRLTAEQAISDLAGIVKELVDNSLDAESTTIKVRIFGQGLEIIEVSDDGCGVPAKSRPLMAARHTTSKITSFDDVYTGTGMTMGFRGEALFSMACSSKQLMIATRTEDDELATKLIFDRTGKLENADKLEQFTRKIGTTTAVISPFHHLPARRADMLRHIKKHRMKIFKLIEAYSIFNVGVCFQLIDIASTSSGHTRENIALNTSASSQKLEETVSSVLGHKFLQSVKPIRIALEPLLDAEYGENLYNWGIKGLISTAAPTPSSAARGGGGKSGLRHVHYYSINGRVVDFPQVTTLMKNLWDVHGKQSKTKTPSAILDFTLPNRSFDINVAPDKQTVVLVHEKAMLELIKEKVAEMWLAEVGGVFHQKDVVGVEANDKDDSKLSKEPLSGDEDGDLEDEKQRHKRRFAFVNDLSQAKMQHDLAARRRSSAIASGEIDPPVPVGGSDEDSPSSKKLRTGEASNHDRDDEGTCSRRQCDEQKRVSDLERQKWNEIQSKFHSSRLERFPEEMSENNTNMSQPVTPKGHDHTQTSSNPQGSSLQREPSANENRGRVNERSRSSEDTPPEGAPSLLNLRQFAFQPQGASSDDVPPRRISSMSSAASRDRSNSSLIPGHGNVTRIPSSSTSPESPRPIRQSAFERKVTLNVVPSLIDRSINSTLQQGPVADSYQDDDDKSLKSPECKTVDESSNVDEGTKTKTKRNVIWGSFSGTEAVCQSALRERIQKRKQKRSIDALRRAPTKTSSDDHGKEGESRQNEQATTSVSPSLFGKMEIIGQFNLGFIIAIDPSQNLWILDQHACDERIHYEENLRTMKVQEQPLIRPLPIELSPAEEACVLDHMDVFQANGFRFAFDNDAPIRHRLSLRSLPHSGAQQGRNAVQFGPADVRSLCEMLMEGSLYDAGSGGTGTDGTGQYGNNAVRHSRFAGSALREDRILARLPKAVAMCASRACRSSIMIGTSLSSREMEAVVRKLPSVLDPWNCAHGRPTSTMLGSVVPLLYKDQKRAASHYSDPTATITPMTQETER